MKTQTLQAAQFKKPSQEQVQKEIQKILDEQLENSIHHRPRSKPEFRHRN